MSDQKTSQEWVELEQTKRNDFAELEAKIALANARRGDLLLTIGETGGKDAKAELATVEKTLRELANEREAANAYLAAIPERRDFARAREIEDEITSLEYFDELLKQSIPAIDAAAENFVLELQQYYGVLESLREVNLKAFHYASMDIGALDSIGVFLRQYDLWRFVKVGKYRDAKTMTDNLERNPTRKQIAHRIHRMRETAKRLRGETVEREYCPNCYGDLILSGGPSLSDNLYTGSASQRRVCKDCGREAK